MRKDFKTVKPDCSEKHYRHCAYCGCADNQHEHGRGKCLALFCAMDCQKFIVCRHTIPPHICHCKTCGRRLGEVTETIVVPGIREPPKPKLPTLTYEEKLKKLEAEIEALSKAGMPKEENENNG